MSFKLTDYFPAAADLSQETLLEVRSRLATHLQAAFPSLDIAPNSVFGDLILTPWAYEVAAAEAAIERVLSDLDLENVANNIVYNCDFVRAYLKNFAIDEQKVLRASGLVRLVFNANATVTIDRRAQYLFGTDNIFKLRLPFDGPLTLVPVGQVPTPATNSRALSALSPTQFFVDLPVIGSLQSTVVAGTQGSTDLPLAGLVNISAVADFNAGALPDSLASLARRTRETSHAASLSTRGGAVAFLLKEFPDLRAVSPVISGDSEMLRDTVNALGVADGRMDVYVKGTSGLLSETQVVRLNYVDLQNAVAVDKFIGRLSLAHVPVVIESITALAKPTQAIAPVIYAQSSDPVRAPLLTAAYSRLEKLWLVVDMPRDGDSLPLLERLTDEAGDYAWFEVTYRYEPLLEVVDDIVSSSAYRPVGIDVLARSYLPIVISQLQVNFYKPAGTTFNLTQARDEILAYFQKLAYPEIYTDSLISDALLYAGASGIRSIACTAEVQWTVADRVVPDTVAGPDADFAAFHAASRVPPALPVTSTAVLPPDYVDANLGTGTETLVACGKRNLGFVLDEANLVLSEISV